VGMPAYYARHELSVLDIFSKYSLKIPRIYSNMLKYTRIYSIFPCQARRVGKCIDNFGLRDGDFICYSLI
jgi:hypothetical protein